MAAGLSSIYTNGCIILWMLEVQLLLVSFTCSLADVMHRRSCALSVLVGGVGQVNFSYNESGENRQALVKLRVCPR